MALFGFTGSAAGVRADRMRVADAAKQAPLVVTYTGRERAANTSSGGTMVFVWTERQTLRPGAAGFGTAGGSTSTTLTSSGKIAYTEKLGLGTPCTGTFSAADGHTAPVTILASSRSTTVTVQVPDSSQYVRSTGADPCSAPFAGVGGFSMLPPLSWKNPANNVSVTRSLKAPSFSGSYKRSYSSGAVSYSVQAKLTISAGTPTCDAGRAPPADACYVALGDSYSAGMIDGKAPCYRSAHGYPRVYDRDVQSWACSGASIKAVEDTQLSHLRPTTKLVTITVGGNDTAIIGGMILCIQKLPTWIDHLATCIPTEETPEYSLAEFGKLRLRLADLYGEIHARAPKARIYVLGYPNPLPAAGPAEGCAGLAPVGRTSLKYFSLLPRAIPYYHKLLERLNATIHFAVTDSRVASYISPDKAFSGHDMCSKQPLFIPITLLPGRALSSLHPDIAGHIVLANLLRDEAGPPPGQ